MTTTRLVSPTIARLQERVELGELGAVAELWEYVERAGAPLVEACESGAEHLVTFLWRDRLGDTKNVLVVGGPATWQPLEDDLMDLVPGTDVWFRTYRVDSALNARYMLSPNDSLVPSEEVEDWVARELTFCHDPLNPRSFRLAADDEVPDRPGEAWSLLELPDAPPQRWADVRSDVPAGAVVEHRLASVHLGNERRVWVVTPAGYDPKAEPYSLLIAFDGWGWACALPLAPTLDNLRADGEIAPLVAVLVDSLDDETRVRELECHEPFVRFLETELLPWVHERWNVTDDPGRSIVAGQSLGGLAAAYVGIELSHRFGGVISQSGSYWFRRGSDGDRDAELLTRRFAREPVVPLRFFLEVGSLEGEEMVMTNRRFRDVLVKRGYDVVYEERCGGHEGFAWRGSFARGLRALAGSGVG